MISAATLFVMAQLFLSSPVSWWWIVLFIALDGLFSQPTVKVKK